MGKDSHALVTGLFMVTLIVSIVVIVIWLGDVNVKRKPMWPRAAAR